jgi:hypothetical protein
LADPRNLDSKSHHPEHQHPRIIRGSFGRSCPRSTGCTARKKDTDVCGVMGRIDTLEDISRHIRKFHTDGVTREGQGTVLDNEEGGVWTVEWRNDSGTIRNLLAQVRPFHPAERSADLSLDGDIHSLNMPFSITPPEWITDTTFPPTSTRSTCRCSANRCAMGFSLN